MRLCSVLYSCVLPMVLWCSASLAQPLLGGGAQWYPYSYQDDDGQAKGIAVDIVRKVMAQNGHEVNFVFYPANRLNRLLDEGRLDLNYADSPLWNTADAGERFVYSQPYLQIREYLYFLSDHPARLLPLEKLQGLRIGIVRGYAYQSLEAPLKDKRLVKVETSREPALLDLLMLGRVDAIVVVDDVFAELLTARHLEHKRFVRGAKLSDAPLVIKLQRQHANQLPGLNAALQTLIRSGEVERIRRSYLLNQNEKRSKAAD
ncbi:transporter substrate-binding domain-containing protein [Pseudomonas sp. MM211]|uniref:substrate-binding periplasmic protein n=1 Tax=Pseudomonas sp. MM211 TaxID=2866808 RepID=UPI001CEC8B3C|nr:transporter substrate-binding domain-containing protein [Pseudomonas sp. MM211]UCJ14858.1 transporter substrate-binding domain-containing protein [Pseudomonas sp. MM211]